MPKALLIGDSISIGYFPHAQQELAGEWEVVRQRDNCGDSANLLAHLDDYLADGGAGVEVVHFNCGLHDLRYFDDQRHQVEIDPYISNLTAIVHRLQATGLKLVWATITPVRDRWNTGPTPPFGRRNSDVVLYNGLARSIMTSAGIAVNDLYAAVQEAGLDKSICPDGTHMTDAGYTHLGYCVAKALRENY